MKLPIEVSARHIHLDVEDCLALFGTDELHKRNDLSQKGEFACDESVEVAGPQNRFTKVRVLGPLRNKSQLEISRSDSFYLGIDAPLALSGEGVGENIKIVGPRGSLIKPIAMVARRHFHVQTETAKRLRIRNNQKVALKVSGDRALIFENIIVRIADGFVNRIHLDTDEGNAAAIGSASHGELITRL